MIVHSAAIQDRDCAALVLDRSRQRFNRLGLDWADGRYNARQVEHGVAAQPPLRVEIVKRPDDSSGFIALPRRLVVERTFSWFGPNRRLAKDYARIGALKMAVTYVRDTAFAEDTSRIRKNPDIVARLRSFAYN